VKPEPETGTWLQDVEQIDIAAESELATSDRAEHLQGRNSVALTHLSQALRVDVDGWHKQRVFEKKRQAVRQPADTAGCDIRREADMTRRPTTGIPII
jgi:hypothetical protein